MCVCLPKRPFILLNRNDMKSLYYARSVAKPSFYGHRKIRGRFPPPPAPLARTHYSHACVARCRDCIYVCFCSSSIIHHMCTHVSNILLLIIWFTDKRARRCGIRALKDVRSRASNRAGFYRLRVFTLWCHCVSHSTHI